ncbi:tropomodulin-4 [Eumetopias jubatus]|uniref:tropomodulin-4 n=1 Tax=Eumetopias jubatus TaxID=34886 RepID=UPI001016C13E|nr:tropomodulin-4 [Eumetopias jubatus]
MSSYQKELEKYRDIDEDEILRTLSPEELEQLDCELQEMDPEVGAPAQGTRGSLQAFGKGEGPWVAKIGAAHRAWSRQGARERVSVDVLGSPGGAPDQRRGPTCSPKLIPQNMLLPAGLRQRDQTKKSPTGPLDRDALLQYLEQQALEVKERDDLVPFTGEKKGKPYIQPKREIPVQEQITLEPELEEALANATDAEMCDIAAILGMYTLMSNKQYYDAICSGEICNTEGISSECVWGHDAQGFGRWYQGLRKGSKGRNKGIMERMWYMNNKRTNGEEIVEDMLGFLSGPHPPGVVQPDKYKPVPDEPPNPTNIEEILKSVRNNDKELEEVNLNNIQDIPIPKLTELCEAMKTNTYVRSFSLVATRSGDPIANAVADMLRENRSLQSLNIESNFISSTGLMAVLKAVRENATLTELRVDNQRQWPGDAVEMEMATVLEQCPSIVRFGYHFTQQGPRARAAQAMTRNNELRE